jgi:hypothetical protein
VRGTVLPSRISRRPSPTTRSAASASEAKSRSRVHGCAGDLTSAADTGSRVPLSATERQVDRGTCVRRCHRSANVTPSRVRCGGKASTPLCLRMATNCVTFRDRNGSRSPGCARLPLRLRR